MGYLEEVMEKQRAREEQARREGTPFSSLRIGDVFDFVSPNHSVNSFFETCKKTGPKSYEWQGRDGRPLKSAVGSKKVLVFHVASPAMPPGTKRG